MKQTTTAGVTMDTLCRDHFDLSRSSYRPETHPRNGERYVGWPVDVLACRWAGTGLLGGGP